MKKIVAHDGIELSDDNAQLFIKHPSGHNVVSRRQRLTNIFKKVDTNSLKVVSKLIDEGSESYLLHPVVAAYIEMKWTGLGMFAHALTMLLFFLLALLFSIFVSTIPLPPQSVDVVRNVSNSSSEFSSDSISSGANVLLYLTLVLALLNLLYFLLQVYIHRLSLFLEFKDEFQTWFSFIASTNIIVFLVSILVGGLESALWNAAALGVFFAWAAFNFSLQVINTLNIGVYITMMISTLKLVFKVMAIFFIFLFSFTFSFHVLVGTVDELHYDSVGLSLYSNFYAIIATTDYLTFADLEQDGQLRFSVSVFVLLVFLIIILPIVFINVLLGLAVGDIAAIQKQAVLSRQSVEVRALATLDKTPLPGALKRLVSKRCLRNYPNRSRCMSYLVQVVPSDIFCPVNLHRKTS